jgi:hypothetical protein
MTATTQTASSVMFKERIRDMPNNLDDKENMAYAKIIKSIIELENELKNIGQEKTKAQTAFSCVYKERIRRIKLVKDLNKIGKGKKIPKNKE